MTNASHWSPKDTLTALIVVIIWGINFVPMKMGLEQLSPFELGAGRFLLAAFPWCLFIPFPKVRLRWVLAVAVLQSIGQFSLLFIALQVGMTASLASVLLQTQIFFTALWSFLIYKHRPTQLLWVSMGSATVGLICFAISAVQGDSSQSVTLVGIVFMLSSASMWGMANLVSGQAQRESPDYDAFGYIVWSSLFALLGYVIIVACFVPNSDKWLHWETWQAIRLKTWFSLLFLAWGASLTGYVLWTKLLKRHPANQVAPFSLGVPVIGLLAGMILLGERINTWQWLGTAFVGVALFLVVFGAKLFPKLTKH